MRVELLELDGSILNLHFNIMFGKHFATLSCASLHACVKER